MSARARKPLVSDSMAADAVLAQVSTPTMMSLATKRRSSTLGAGMPTLVRETKKAARSMSGTKRRASPKKRTTKRRTGVRKTRTTKRKTRTTKRRTGVRKTRTTKRKTGCSPRKLKSGKTVRRVRVGTKCVRYHGKAHKLALSLGK